MGPRKLNPAWRVVLDTNIVLSAVLFEHGRLAAIRSDWQARRIVPLVSPATTTELIRVLAYPKFNLTAENQQEFLSEYLPWCEAVTGLPARVRPELRDRSDQPFLALAIGGQAKFLVTGDADLLSLALDFQVPIITGREFVRLVGENTPGGRRRLTT